MVVIVLQDAVCLAVAADLIEDERPLLSGMPTDVD